MTSTPQRTLAGDTVLEGQGLHTGEGSSIRLRPAPPNSGVRFQRMDLADKPEIPATLDCVVSTERCTVLGAGEATVRTVEHLMAALYALEIDNARIEVDGPEIPILDGSFEPFYEAIRATGIAEQDVAARTLELGEPVTAREGGASYVAVPADTLRVSATIDFDHPMIGRQYASHEVNAETFGQHVGPARTFGFLAEARTLHERGLATGASFENAIVLDDTGLAGGELRFADEFVRHKIGDVVGDLALIGARIRAHVIAERPSHAGSLALARSLRQHSSGGQEAMVDVQKIMQYLPHRYPMLLVDRIVEFETGKRIVGIKNVTINEPFFQGHYPGHPIMPGVLIIEAMAQVGGLLLMDAIDNPEEKVVYFMALDNVKWRRPVIPGDQIRFELEVLQLRRSICRVRGVGRVNGRIVAEAEMMARIMDR